MLHERVCVCVTFKLLAVQVDFYLNEVSTGIDPGLFLSFSLSSPLSLSLFLYILYIHIHIYIVHHIVQLDLPALFFLTLPVYIRANRNPHSLTKLALTEPAYFRACCVETCCWKIPVPSPCGRISAQPKSRLFITGGREGGIKRR